MFLLYTFENRIESRRRNVFRREKEGEPENQNQTLRWKREGENYEKERSRARVKNLGRGARCRTIEPPIQTGKLPEINFFS